MLKTKLLCEKILAAKSADSRPAKLVTIFSSTVHTPEAILDQLVQNPQRYSSKMRTTLLILSIAACAGFVPKIPSPAKSTLRAETEAEAEAPPEPAAPAPAPAPAAFDPDKVFKVDESPLMAYISRSWNKLDGSDTVEVQEMLGAASI